MPLALVTGRGHPRRPAFYFCVKSGVLYCILRFPPSLAFSRNYTDLHYLSLLFLFSSPLFSILTSFPLYSLLPLTYAPFLCSPTSPSHFALAPSLFTLSYILILFPHPILISTLSPSSISFLPSFYSLPSSFFAIFYPKKILWYTIIRK